jgi:hypothetical protein
MISNKISVQSPLVHWIKMINLILLKWEVNEEIC